MPDTNELIRYEVDGDGIATLTWDVPGRPVNVLTRRRFGPSTRRCGARWRTTR